MEQRDTQRSGVVNGRLVVILFTALLFALVFALPPQRTVATHECFVGGHMISCNVVPTPPVDDACTYYHVHGTIDGVTDPLGECGWGAISNPEHDEPNGGTAPPEYTFYGRYVTAGCDGVETREPLASTYGTRYLNSSFLDGGLTLQVWRDASPNNDNPLWGD